MNTEIAEIKTPNTSVFGSLETFQEVQRMIVPLVKSTMVPLAYQNKPENCMVAMEMAHRTGRSVLEIMQNMNIVQGKIAWASDYTIMAINRSGLFADSLEFVFTPDRRGCYAVATKKSNGKEIRGTLVTMIMAEKEGWLNRNGSKWKTFPEQMLMYRAATFFCRVHCPEVLAGVMTADEIVDVGNADQVQDLSTVNKLNDEVQPKTSEYTSFEDVATEAATEAEQPAAKSSNDDWE